MPTPTLACRDAYGDRLPALWITADGGVATVQLAADDDQRHRELTQLLDGPATLVMLDERVDLWTNRDSQLRWAPNPMATRVAGAHGHDRRAVHGPVVLTGGIDTHGVVRGLDATTAAMLAELAFYGAAEGPLRPDEIDGRRYRHRRGHPGTGVASCST